jgi:hypothetical protein
MSPPNFNTSSSQVAWQNWQIGAAKAPPVTLLFSLTLRAAGRPRPHNREFLPCLPDCRQPRFLPVVARSDPK